MTSHALRLMTYTRSPFVYGSLTPDLADRARASAVQIRKHQKAAAVEIERELLAMREALPHGQFIVA